jgi:hypothetical protein
MIINLIKRILFPILGFFVFACIMVGCSSFSKEDYLTDFLSFMSEVESNYKNYTDENWKAKELEYQKYVGEHYEKFKDDLTTKEKITVIGYQVKFNYYRTMKYPQSIINEYF